MPRDLAVASLVPLLANVVQALTVRLQNVHLRSGAGGRLMKLINVRVTNFRSVEDSGSFTIEDITCLVGKNEAGKSAILQALAGLNAHSAAPYNYDKERDYPRRYLTHYNERHPDGPAEIVTSRWKIAASDLEKVKDEFGADALTGDEVTIVSYYEGRPKWRIPVDIAAALEHLIQKANLSAPELARARSAAKEPATFACNLEKAEPTEKLKALAAKMKAYPNASVPSRVRALWEPSLPKFMYFSNYDRMAGEVQIEQLQGLAADQSLREDERRSLELFSDFLDFAGTSLDEILEADTYETFNARLKAASNAVTDEIFEYWTQNPFLSVEVTVGPAKSGDRPPLNKGTIARARVNNSIHRVDVPFSERSAGFVWFFSFLVKFDQVKNDDVPVILLLDEPGLTLHGKAQADLLRFFKEKLTPHHQIIYSTHSPFMVDPERLTSARIVEDVITQVRPNKYETEGTKVREDVLSRDPDTVFPLQGALGYEITQSLFVGKHTLLVEGPSDILYLKSLSSAVTKRGGSGLDPKWTMCPTGGIGNIKAFVSLFKGNELNIAVLADYASGQKKQIENLRSSEILEKDAVVTLNEATGKGEADVEDLFEPTTFVDLINEVYSLEAADKLTVQALDTVGANTERLVLKAEAYFRTLPTTVPEFDHFRPSEWLIGNPTFLEPSRHGVEETLDRAEALFTRINALLR